MPRLFLGVTVRHGAPRGLGELARAAAQDGATNRKAEGDKRARYPAGQSPWHALPLALETYGRHGRLAHTYLRKLARAHAARLSEGSDEAVSTLLLRWGCRLSVALQRANAQNLRRGLGADAGAAGLARSLAAELAS